MGIFSKLFSKKENQIISVDNVCAVIVAAGNSTRMNLPENKSKQFLEIDGIAVIGHTMLAYEMAKNITDMVVVTRQEDLLAISDIAKSLGITKLRRVVVGGDTRSISVKNGIAEVPINTKYLAIADGARPLVKPSDIDKVVAVASKHGAATLGCPVTDTLKKVSLDGKIISTVDRDSLYCVSTPQVFDIIKYNATLALCDDITLTDDCQLFEKCGFEVRMVEGGYDNIKVTYSKDVELAQSILEARRCTE